MLHKIFGRAAFCALLLIAAVYTLPAQARGSDLTVKIAVMGPGDELYFWWGHIALVIDDARSGQSRLYDYGLFSFNHENFFVNFALGRLWYSCGSSTAAGNIASYVYTNRDIALYTLDIPPENREKVREFAEESILPENRHYLYHHFRDNCSTRIRDILDLATDEQFSQQLRNEPGRFTLRQHVRRHTWFSPFIDWFLSFLMGRDIDTPITVWEEMFLPSEVARHIQDFQYTNRGGVSRPLVSDVEVINTAYGRPPVLDVPRLQWPRELIFSLVLAVLLGFLFYIQSKSTALGQVPLGIFHCLSGIIFGGSGLVLFFMSNFTEHDYTFHNANLLFGNPLLLLAIPYGIRYASSINYNRRLKSEIILRTLWFLTALGVIISMLTKLSPGFHQQNLTEELLMLPIALVLSLEPAGLKRMFQRIFWRWQ